jgi:two-component system nitrate/nitrite response regulator NarL
VGVETGSGSPVLVVDDDANCRALISSLLERIGCTIYQTGCGAEALALAETLRPQLVVLDVGIPGVTGYEVCRELRDRYGHALAIVFVSGTRVEPPDRVAGLLIGGDEYIVKPFDPDELVARVRRLLRQADVRAPNSNANDSSRVLTLTAREREVLVLLARGRAVDEIAGELYISPKTVATHIQRVLPKLGVHSRSQAVALAHREGLLGDVQAHVAVVTAHAPAM